MRALLGITGLFGLLACDGSVAGLGEPTGVEVRFQPAAELDLLLMIDNTFGTSEEQAGAGGARLFVEEARRLAPGTMIEARCL